jgi:hypothetical protein
LDPTKVILNGFLPQTAGFNITESAEVGGDMTVGGDLTVGGKVFGGQTLTGYLQPQNWSYSKTAPVPTWAPLWSGQLSVARPSLLWLSLQGAWSSTSGECFATILVDDVPLAAPCGTALGQCWGAAFIYGASARSPLGYTGFASVAPGTHTLAAAVVPGVSNTCTLSGMRIFYAITPQ